MDRIVMDVATPTRALEKMPTQFEMASCLLKAGIPAELVARLPFEKVISRELKYVKGAGKVEARLKTVAEGADFPIFDTIAGSIIEGEIPRIAGKYFMAIDKEVELRNAILAGDKMTAALLVKKIYEDQAGAVQRASNTLADFIIAGLKDGLVRVNKTNAINYGFRASKTMLALDHADSDLIEEIMAILAELQGDGIMDSKYLACSPKFINKVAKYPAVVALFTANGARITKQNVMTFFESEFGLTLLPITHKSWGEGDLTILSEGQLGKLIIPLSNFEIKKAQLSGKMNIVTTSEGLTLMTKLNEENASTEYRVDLHGMPSFENSEGIQIIKIG